MSSRCGFLNETISRNVASSSSNRELGVLTPTAALRKEVTKKGWITVLLDAASFYVVGL